MNNSLSEQNNKRLKIEEEIDFEGIKFGVL